MGTGFYPAMGGGGFARTQELDPWLDRIAVRGEAAVMLGVGEEREVERIPEPLRRFL
jgi:hypothetical protein